MSNLDDFMNSQYKSGQVRLFNSSENTTGYVAGGSIQSKTGATKGLYDKLTAANALNTAEAITVSTNNPKNNLIFRNLTYTSSYAVPPVWTGTYWVGTRFQTYNDIVYSTDINGPWTSVPNQLAGYVYTLEWVSAKNKLLIGRPGTVSTIDLASGFSSTTAEVLIASTLNSFAAVSWNGTMDKVVYEYSEYTATTAIVNYVAITGGTATAMASAPAFKLLGLRCIGGTTYGLFTNTTGTQVCTAAAGATTWTQVSTNTTVPYGVPGYGNKINCIESNGSTTIVIAYTQNTSYYMNYYYYNGSWNHTTTTQNGQGYGYNGAKVVYWNSKWYFSTYTYQTYTVATLGGAQTLLSSTYKNNSNTQDRITIYGVYTVGGNTRLWWSYFMVNPSPIQVWSTSNDLSTNYNECVTYYSTTNILAGGVSTSSSMGFKSSNTTMYMSIMSPNDTLSGTSYPCISFYSSTDYGSTYGLESIYWDTAHAGYSISTCSSYNVVSAGEIFFTGSYSYLMATESWTSGTNYYNTLFIKSSDNFATVSSNLFSWPWANDFSSPYLCVGSSCTDGTAVYFGMYYIYYSGDTGRQLNIYKWTLSTGAFASVASINTHACGGGGADYRSSVAQSYSYFGNAIWWDSTTSRLVGVHSGVNVYDDSQSIFGTYSMTSAGGSLLTTVTTAAGMGLKVAHTYPGTRSTWTADPSVATGGWMVCTTHGAYSSSYTYFVSSVTSAQTRTAVAAPQASKYGPDPDGNYWYYNPNIAKTKYTSLFNASQSLASANTGNSYFVSMPTMPPVNAGYITVVVDANTVVQYLEGDSTVYKQVRDSSNFVVPTAYVGTYIPYANMTVYLKV